MCVERVSAMCTAGMPRSRSVALEGRLVGCLYTSVFFSCCFSISASFPLPFFVLDFFLCPLFFSITFFSVLTLFSLSLIYIFLLPCCQHHAYAISAKVTYLYLLAAGCSLEMYTNFFLSVPPVSRCLGF